MGKFLATSLPGEIGGFAFPVCEKEKWRLSRRFFAHEEHRNMRIKKEQDHDLLEFVLAGQLRQPLSERAIADLIVVLSKKDRGLRRQVTARLTAWLVMRWEDFSLISEAFGKRAGKMLKWLVREGVIITFFLA